MNPLFSIIVPVYNAEKYLDNCIQSLTGQEYSNLEIILVDDGSRDSSFEICEHYQNADNRIKLFRKENGGQGSARNVALKHATGDYILFVDSDDTIAKDTISKNLVFFKDNPRLDFVQFPVYFLYGTDSAYIRASVEEKYGVQDDFIKLTLQDNVISWIVCDKIFRRDLIEGMKFREDMKYEDNYFMMELLPELSEVYISNKGMYYYYHRENSTTTSSSSKLKENSTKEVLLRQLELINSKRDKKLFYIYLSRLINVEKSLRVGFTESSNHSLSFKDQISAREVVLEKNLPLKEKIKILSLKFKQ